MKTPSADLFLLIRSLSPQEKKYFKQYSRGYSEERDNKYLLLFDAIEEQAVYDEEAIRIKFKGQDLVNNLSVAKIYLAEKILDSIIAMNSETDEALLLKKRISYFEILEKRRLSAAALNAYKKASDMALDTGSLSLLPHIASHKNSIVTNTGKGVSKEESIKNAEEAIHHARVLENYLRYELINIKVYNILVDSTLHVDPRKKEALGDLLLDPLLSGEEEPLSFKAWAMMTRLRYRIHWVRNINLESYRILEEGLAYLAEHKADTVEWQSTALKFQVDYIDMNLKLRYYNRTKAGLDNLREMIALKYQPQIYSTQWHFTFTMIYHSVSGIDIKCGIRYWEERNSWWQKERPKFKTTTNDKLLFHVFTLYFMAADWVKAIHLLNELITLKTSSQTERAVRIYWLMLQYEIQNIEQLQVQASGIHDWFKKTAAISEPEKDVIRFFEKIHKAANKKDMMERMRELHKKLEEQDKEGFATSLTASGDMMLWLESKISNTTMDKVLQSKAQEPAEMVKQEGRHF